MPELPEVETLRGQIEPRLINRLVIEADGHPSAKFSDASAVTDATLTEVRRRGKFLIIPTTDGREMIIHLGMTGQISFHEGPPSEGKYVRAWWRLDDDGGDRPAETMEFSDVRRFGRVRVVAAGDYESMPTLHQLGPEPFDESFTAAEFAERLKKSRRPIKTHLLSQRPIAGVGNIYADEALWLARINPKARRIGAERASDLLDAIRAVLQQGLDNSGTTLKDYRTVDGGYGENQFALTTYGRGGQPCQRCGRQLHREELDARTTTWCKTCQSH